jgi:hypothetical protein
MKPEGEEIISKDAGREPVRACTPTIAQIRLFANQIWGKSRQAGR